MRSENALITAAWDSGDVESPEFSVNTETFYPVRGMMQQVTQDYTYKLEYAVEQSSGGSWTGWMALGSHPPTAQIYYFAYSDSGMEEGY